MADEERVRTYEIPDNFIDESRILNGMFKTRNFIEGVAMALVAAIPALLIPVSTLNARIIVLVAFCGPFFLLGNAGYNGDPISTTFLHAKNWRQNRGIMLYNANSRALKESPLEHMENTELPRDKLVDMVDSWKNARRRKNGSMVYIEGETFEFVEDDDIAYLYLPEDEPEELATMLVVPEGAAANCRKPPREPRAIIAETSAVGNDSVADPGAGDGDVVTIEIPDGE